MIPTSWRRPIDRDVDALVTWKLGERSQRAPSLADVLRRVAAAFAQGGEAKVDELVNAAVGLCDTEKAWSKPIRPGQLIFRLVAFSENASPYEDNVAPMHDSPSGLTHIGAGESRSGSVTCDDVLVCFVGEHPMSLKP